MTCNTDILVIGGGPGGVAASLEAAKRGATVALAEANDLGGTCLNWGCIPTKQLLGGTSAVEELAAQKKTKVLDGELTVNLPAMQTKKDRLLAGSRKAIAAQLKAAGVTFLHGKARLTGPTSAVVEGASEGGEATEVTFKSCILATGTAPSVIPSMEPDNKAVLNSDQMLALQEAPESLIVVGAGAIGLEMSQIFHRMGAKITIVEAMDRLAPLEDEEISKELQKILKRRKYVMKTGVRVASLKTVDGNAELTLEDGEVITAEKALVAIGRKPLTADLGTETTGAELVGPGFVKVDETLKAADTIYAIGDVNGLTMLAHAAEHQARYVARQITGAEPKKYDPKAVPSCVYGDPEIMRVGKMPADLKSEGRHCQTSKFNLIANPIAQSHAATQGFVKVVWSEGKVVGVTAIGNHVSSLTTLATVMVVQGWTLDNVDEVIFPHPTLDEGLLEALHGERINY